MRVVSRLFCIEADIAKASSRGVFDKAMRTIISHDEPGEFNQALMDLGSSICTPTSPLCEGMSTARILSSLSAGNTNRLSRKIKKAKPKDMYYIAGAIEEDGRFYWCSDQKLAC